MRICHITSMHNWNDDRIYQRACLGLARKGHEVHLIATKPDNIPKEQGVQFHWLEQRTNWRRRWFSSREAVDKALTIDAEIYHFHDPDLLLWVNRIKKKKPESSVIYDIHENYAGRFQNWGLPSFLGKWFQSYEKQVMKKIDGFTTVSDSMSALFSDIQKPNTVIRNSTDIDRLRELELDNITPYDPPTIYTSGSHSHARNCRQTVLAMKYVDQALDYQMVFAGRYAPNMENELMIQAEIDGTVERLHLEGMLPWEENFNRTAKAFAGCVFYEDNPNNRVGIPNRLFEFMYCGLPVIATDFPELRNIIKDAQCGLLVDSEDPRSIAKAISYLLKNPSDAKAMGQRGRNAMESKYGYHIDLKLMIDFYTQITAKKNA